jgi:hypothetical protein
LVHKYLEHVGSKVDHKKIVIQRNEINTSNENSTGKTYRDIIRESLKSSQERHTHFREIQEVISKERSKMAFESTQLINRETSKITRILKTASTIKATADQIMESSSAKLVGKTKSLPFL